MANFSDNLNKTIATGVNIAGQARALADALGILRKSPKAISTPKYVAAEINRNGVSRSTHAYSVIYPPSSLMNIAALKPRQGTTMHSFLTYRNDAFSTPGLGLTTTDIRRFGYGPTEKRPTGITYQDVTFNYILDTYGNQHKFFYKWLDNIVKHHEPKYGNPSNYSRQMYEVSYKEDYACEIEIVSFDERIDGHASGFNMNVITLQEAYPIFIGDIQYNWANSDSIVRLPVTFTYRKWQSQSLNIQEDIKVVGSAQNNLFGNLLKVGTALQALSTLKRPRNIQDIVGITNTARVLR